MIFRSSAATSVHSITKNHFIWGKNEIIFVKDGLIRDDLNKRPVQCCELLILSLNSKCAINAMLYG